MPRSRRKNVSGFPPLSVVGDGFAPVTVASRFGKFTLRRQVLEPSDGSTHRIPGNAYLPPHQSIIITRGLQEWACLLPQDLSFTTASRLLGWQPQPEPLLSDTTIRTLVRQHGQALREAEHAEACDLLQRADLATLTPALTTSQPPRGRAAWPPELAAAVEAALAAGAERAPEGVTAADWARVLARHQQEPERSVAQLRTLGPQVQPDEVLVVPDEVCTRKTGGGFWELRTARVSTSAGTRYVSGTGASFLTVLLVLVLLCAGRDRRLLVVADGARWIRAWAAQLTERWPKTQLLLDWFHLRKRCSEWGSMACGGRKAKAALLRPVYRHLWRGEVADAIAVLEAYRPEARNVEWLDKLITYLREREPYIPPYGERRRTSQYIGSGQVEKANDQIVAQRQKGAGMRWSLDTSDALAALRTLHLNGGWDAYWTHRQMPSLVTD
jgi:hypothetical protein